MPWWSWGIIGYVGLIVILTAALTALCRVIELRSRLQYRRLVCEAEQFLAEMVPTVGSSSAPR